MAWLTSALTALVTCLALQQLVQLWRHRNDLRSVLCSAADDAGVEDGSWSAGQGGVPQPAYLNFEMALNSFPTEPLKV